MIQIKSGIFLSKSEITFQASRSGGPGGQHVNKVNSKVVLIYPLDKIVGVSEKQQLRIREKLFSYVVENQFRISSQKHRSQYSNKMDATEKLISLIRSALKENKPRIKTKIPRSATLKRLDKKNKRSQIKKSRNTGINNEE